MGNVLRTAPGVWVLAGFRSRWSLWNFRVAPFFANCPPLVFETFWPIKPKTRKLSGCLARPPTTGDDGRTSAAARMVGRLSWWAALIGTPDLVTIHERQSVIPVTAEGVLPLTLQAIGCGRRGSCAGGMQRWTRHISGIKPKPVCAWRRACRGTIRREESSSRLAEEFQRQAEELDVATGAEQRRAR